MLSPEVVMRSSDTDANQFGTLFIDTTITRYTRAEWDLLVRLPGRMVAAATSDETAGARQSVIEALAGLNAIAAGRGSPNALVRQVVGTIYAELDLDSPSTRDVGNADDTASFAPILAACRQAAAILADHGSDADRLAYEKWLESIAIGVCDASPMTGDVGATMMRVATERYLLAELADAFR
jgi:hypothetical protein